MLVILGSMVADGLDSWKRGGRLSTSQRAEMQNRVAALRSQLASTLVTVSQHALCFLVASAHTEIYI